MSKAFTLIELLIVVLIIAILAAIAVPNFLEFQTRAKVSRVKSDLRSFATAVEAYYVDNNKFPPANPPMYANAFGISCNRNTGDLDCEIARLIPFTTPIAYISSLEIMKDPFVAGQATLGLSGNVLGYEAIYGYAEWSNQTGWWDTGMVTQGRNLDAWALMSTGPDAQQSGTRNFIKNASDAILGGGAINEAQFYSIIYDPTNGTVSPGDVIRVGGAHVGRVSQALSF